MANQWTDKTAIMVSSLLNKKLKLFKKAKRKQRFIKISSEIKVVKTIHIHPRPNKVVDNKNTRTIEHLRSLSI